MIGVSILSAELCYTLAAVRMDRMPRSIIRLCGYGQDGNTKIVYTGMEDRAVVLPTAICYYGTNIRGCMSIVDIEVIL